MNDYGLLTWDPPPTEFILVHWKDDLPCVLMFAFWVGIMILYARYLDRRKDGRGLFTARCGFPIAAAAPIHVTAPLTNASNSPPLAIIDSTPPTWQRTPTIHPRENKAMKIEISGEAEQILRAALASGKYASVEDFITTMAQQMNVSPAAAALNELPERIDLEQAASAQAVGPVRDFRHLQSAAWPENESAVDLLEAIHQLRDEEAPQKTS